MNTINVTTSSSEDADSSDTTTFIIGFVILLVFVIIGILSSVFLCMILKKDPYLWEIGLENQLQQSQQKSETTSKEVDISSSNDDSKNVQNSQV
ncbi:hypothetical protein FQR65_LT01436 [Abscondita terminalis]|nr:hypothetical protein FQR65_LT01436 [Abscondita terminalis]